MANGPLASGKFLLLLVGMFVGGITIGIGAAPMGTSFKNQTIGSGPQCPPCPSPSCPTWPLSVTCPSCPKPPICRAGSESSEPMTRDERLHLETSFSDCAFGFHDSSLAIKDAVALNAALTKWNTNETAVLSIFARSSFCYLQEVRSAYAKKFSVSLDEHINSKTYGSFSKLLLLNLLSEPHMYAKILRSAIDGWFTDDEEAIIDCLAFLLPGDLLAVQYAYSQMYPDEVPLPAGIADVLSGDIKLLLSHLATFPRYSGVRTSDLSSDADILHKAIELPWWWRSNDAAIVELVGNSSGEHLIELSKMYMVRYGKSLPTVFSNVGWSPISSSYRDALTSLAITQEEHLVRRLHWAATRWFGGGTSTLVRSIALGSRRPGLLFRVMRLYEKQVGVSLAHHVISADSGYLGKLIVGMLDTATS